MIIKLLRFFGQIDELYLYKYKDIVYIEYQGVYVKWRVRVEMDQEWFKLIRNCTNR